MTTDAKDADEQKLDIDEEELLQLVASEMRAAIGFENDSDLIAQRERAAYYARGVMPDVPSRPKRSSVVSTEVADAIETIMPILIDIFTSGDDVITFKPHGPEDEDQAAQESDYVTHVFFNENDGWLNLYTALKDALLMKTGIFKWWWQEDEDPEPQVFDGKNQLEVHMLLADYPDAQVRPCDDRGPEGEPLYDVTIQKEADGRLIVQAVDPNDFAICRDAVKIKAATYVATRSRPRAQDLIAMGIDADVVEELPAWSPTNVNGAETAKDTVQETIQGSQGFEHSLRQVLVVEHYLKLNRNGKTQTYQVLTDWNCASLLRAQRVNSVQIAAGSPFINTHRFYGESLADKLIEIQRIKTVLVRMALDEGYFALNQRPTVNMKMTNQQTIDDLLMNEPGRPIRVQGPDAIEWPSGGKLAYNAWEALEYASTMGEQRTGIMRNAQGLSPDTMHDTATGAIAMLTEAQRRIRMIARNLGETLLKDTYLGIHAVLCAQASQKSVVKLRNKWVPVDPSQWQLRNDMTIEIGVGASGREHDLMAAQTIGTVQQQLFEAQGGAIDGPLTNAKSMNATAVKIAQSLGFKNPEQYFPDPDNYQAPPQAPPPPDPKLLAAQTQAATAQQANQLKAQSAQVSAQAQAQKMQADFEIKMQKLANDHQHATQKLAADTELMHQKYAAELALKHEQAMAQLALKQRISQDSEISGDPGS